MQSCSTPSGGTLMWSYRAFLQNPPDRRRQVMIERACLYWNGFVLRCLVFVCCVFAVAATPVFGCMFDGGGGRVICAFFCLITQHVPGVHHC